MRDGFFVGVKANVFAFFGHIHTAFYVHFPANNIGQIVGSNAFVSIVEAMLESISHGHKLYVLFRQQRLYCRSGAAPAAANEGNFDGVVCKTVGRLC